MPGAPLPSDEPARLTSLKSLELLDSPAEPLWDRLTELASLVCDTPIALVSILDEQRQWFKSKVGLNVQETPRDQAFCGHAILERDMFIVEDASLDPRFVENPLVTGNPRIRFYAGAQLHAPDGQKLGTLCAIDRHPRRLNDRQKQALRLLADQAQELLTYRLAAIQLRKVVEAEAKLSHPASAVINEVSHELNTPMTPIVLSLQILKDTLAEDATSQAHLERVERNLSRLRRVVKEATDRIVPAPKD